MRLQKWQIEKIQRGIRQADAGEFASDEEVAEVFFRAMGSTRPNVGEGLVPSRVEESSESGDVSDSSLPPAREGTSPSPTYSDDES
jgi:hypothetical protein